MMIHRVGERLAPHMVRAKLFGRRWRGFDPGRVIAYLDEVAGELTRLDQELGQDRSEVAYTWPGLGRVQIRHMSSRFSDPAWLDNGRRR
ncbi:MAG TPA: cell division protein DivIVA [Micromonospora sp.]